ncbi:MAG: hypothetical protein DCC65_17055 [Planctomycetota bacterium]|nr:MAG: hypothetical protein DCC65_17055 [Planctomycetota bacterium]
MRTSRHLIAMLTIAIGTAATASAAPTWQYYAGGDAGFLALSNNGALERAVTESRIGNNAANGTWELAVWQQGGVGTPVDTDQKSWTNGLDTAFSLQYDGVNSVTYTVGGTTVTWSGLGGGFTDIFIRTRSATDSTLTLSGLDLDGLAIGNLVSSGNGDVDYIRIRNMGMDFGAFTLTGTQNFAWAGAQPSNSALAYQIKLTNVIPEPGTLSLLAVGGLGLLRRRRR